MKQKHEELTTKYVRHKIKDLFSVDITESDLNNFYRLGKNIDLPIKIEFTSFLKKAEMFRNNKNLRGLGISMANDLTFKQRQQSRILRKHLYLAKGNKKLNCYIKRNQLYVNGKMYTPEDLLNEEERDTVIEEKPHSAPGTPTTKKNQPPIIKPQ